jgi:hypothetical protein
MQSPSPAALVRHRSRCSALVLALAAAVVACGDSPSGPEPITRTFLSFESDAGDWIGQGGSAYYTLADGEWSIQNHGPGHISIYVSGSDWWWTFDIAAPAGQRLAVGTYEGAARWPFQGDGQPGLDFSGTGRGCNQLTGQFVIHEMERGDDATLQRFHASFRQHCEGQAPALHGEIGIVANPWR